MLFVCYETGAGYGSCGRVLEHDEGWIRIDDPLLGEAVVDPLKTVHVMQLPSGLVLPFHHFGTTEFLELVANPVGSGYPMAWEKIRHWRDTVAPRWQTVALVGIFAALTVRDSYEMAEEIFEDVGPTIRAFLRGNILPTEPMIEQLLVERGYRGLRERRASTIASVLPFSGPLAKRLRRDPDFGRGFRNRAALEMRLPDGIGLAKFSFWVSLLGRDAACIDTAMLRWWFGEEYERVAERFQKEKVRGKRVRISDRMIVDYNALEDMLRDEPGVWKAKWPMPYARAQWLLWEKAVGDEVTHETLFRVAGRR